MEAIQEFLEGKEVRSRDFTVEVSEAEPFIFEWHSHSRPGPSFSGHEYTEYKTDGEAVEIETNHRYDYPCFNDHDYKVSLSDWTWLLRYHYRQYATDDMSYESLMLTVKNGAIADVLISVIRDCLGFGLQDAQPSHTRDITELVRTILGES